MTEQTSPVLETDLSKDGGGLLYLELVPKASLGKLVKRGAARCVKAHLEVDLSCAPDNLASGEVSCSVRWKLPKGELDGAKARLDVGKKTVTPWLELTSTQAVKAGVGQLLESPGEVSITVAPDVPYTGSATVKLAAGEVPELSLTLSWAGEAGKKLGAMPAAPGLRLGDEVKLKLERSSWRCRARLRVTATLDDKSKLESLIDFGTTDEDQTWRVGYDHGVLRFPALTGKKKLGFTLELQVSEDDQETFASIVTRTIEVPGPTLKGLRVRLGDGVEDLLQGTWAGFWQDRYVHVMGELDGIFAQAELPFAAELWGYSPGPSPEAPGTIHPIFEHQAAIGRLEGGKLDVEVARIDTPDKVHAIRGLRLFAVLRAAAGASVPPLPSALQHSLRLFSDEDFNEKGPGLGICSEEIGKDVKGNRAPLLLGAWWEVTTAGLIKLSCTVCGPRAGWKDAKLVLATGAKSSEVEVAKKPAVCAPVPGSARGVISASFSFAELKSAAGQKVTARVNMPAAVGTAPGGGATEFLAQPKILPARWRKDEDERKRPRLRLVCHTHYYPRDKGSGLLVKLSVKKDRSGPYDDMTSKLSFPNKSAVDREGKLEAFIMDKAAIEAIEPRLKARAVAMSVEPSAEAAKALSANGFVVALWSGAPEEETSKDRGP